MGGSQVQGILWSVAQQDKRPKPCARQSERGNALLDTIATDTLGQKEKQMTPTRELALGKWPGILSRLGVDESFLLNRHGPCPNCGGKDRYRFSDQEGTGSYYCSQCGPGDGFDLL